MLGSGQLQGVKSSDELPAYDDTMDMTVSILLKNSGGYSA
jgi:hypothetical protein